MNSFRVLSDDFDQLAYDKAVDHPFQSWTYGKALQNFGLNIIRFGQFKNNQLYRAYQISLHKIPMTDYYLAHLPRGQFPNLSQLGYMKKILNKMNVIYLRIEPYINDTEVDSMKVRKSDILVRSPQSLTYDYTIQIDLSVPETELFKRLNSKTRYNIRLAKRKEVYVKEMTNDRGFKIFTKLLFETCKRKKFYAKSERYHKAVFDRLKNNISYIFITFYQNTPLAAYELFLFKNKAHFLFGGSSDKFRNLMGSNLLMWQVLLFAKCRGCNIFDMSETLGPAADKKHPWYGLTNFAQGYGGSFVKLLTNYDFPVNKQLYPYYQNLISNMMRVVNKAYFNYF